MVSGGVPGFSSFPDGMPGDIGLFLTLGAVDPPKLIDLDQFRGADKSLIDRPQSAGRE
jgi:hypothetical protein